MSSAKLSWGDRLVLVLVWLVILLWPAFLVAQCVGLIPANHSAECNPCPEETDPEADCASFGAEC